MGTRPPARLRNASSVASRGSALIIRHVSPAATYVRESECAGRRGSKERGEHLRMRAPRNGIPATLGVATIVDLRAIAPTATTERREAIAQHAGALARRRGRSGSPHDRAGRFADGYVATASASRRTASVEAAAGSSFARTSARAWRTSASRKPRFLSPRAAVSKADASAAAPHFLLAQSDLPFDVVPATFLLAEPDLPFDVVPAEHVLGVQLVVRPTAPERRPLGRRGRARRPPHRRGRAPLAEASSLGAPRFAKERRASESASRSSPGLRASSCPMPHERAPRGCRR
jgi:hypothetical protein